MNKIDYLISEALRLNEYKNTLSNIETIIGMIEYQIEHPETYTHGTISICCNYDLYSDKPRHHEIKISELPWKDIKAILGKRKKEIETEFEKILNKRDI